jgi:hypothetical protein
VDGDLVALIGDAGQGAQLWELSAASAWKSSGSVPGITAIGRYGNGVVLAGGARLQLLPEGVLASATDRPLTWPSAGTPGPIAAVDASPNGTLAVVGATDTELQYGLVASDGTVTRLDSAPPESFTPLVGWIDADRVLVLAFGSDMESRLAVLDVRTAALTQLNAQLGIRVFAVSPGLDSVATATEEGIYVGSRSDWLAGKEPVRVATLGPAEVAWGLALDRSGAHLAYFVGNVAPDGQVSGTREVIWSRTGSGWSKTHDAAVPFGQPVGQVWVD